MNAPRRISIAPGRRRAGVARGTVRFDYHREARRMLALRGPLLLGTALRRQASLSVDRNNTGQREIPGKRNGIDNTRTLRGSTLLLRVTLFVPFHRAVTRRSLFRFEEYAVPCSIFCSHSESSWKGKTRFLQSNWGQL